MKPKYLTLALVSFLLFPLTASATNAPSSLAATGASSSQVNLAWTDNSTDETGFTFAYDTNSGLTSPTYVYAGGVNTTSFSHTGRSAATTYYYKIKAEGNPDSAWTSIDSATTAPSGLAATATSNNAIQLTWTGNGSNTAITGYTYAYADNSSFTGATYKYVAGNGSTSASQAGLSAGTTYWFKIKAEGTSDSLDSPYGTVASATTTSTSTGQPAISPHFAGLNAWMPYQIGSNVYNGKLEQKWIEVEESGAKIMRYGGNGVDHHANPASSTTLDQYVDMVDAMRSRGIEPVLQVPVYNWTYSASQAADIVRYVNITNSRGVKYWSIGNEPDLQSGVYQYTSSSQVAAYIKPFASAMKQVDPSIKILGPETAWYNETIINGLTSCTGNPTTDANSIAGKDSNGRYYVDILSFHIYGFDGTQSRSDVISKLMSPGGFNDDLSALQDRLDLCNTLHDRTGDNALKIAVTEANVDHTQPANDGVTVNGADGLGAASFLGGQFWAELMGIAMQQGVDFVNFWSVIEGGSSHPESEIGYFSGDGFTIRPSYYHFQMMAQNFRGSSVTATESQANVKTFASKDVDQIAVLILNQETSTSFNYTVRLNNGTVSGSNPLKINVDAGVAAEFNGVLGPESSLLLVFNSSGAIKKKIEYTRSGHAIPEDPPSVTTYP